MCGIILEIRREWKRQMLHLPLVEKLFFRDITLFGNNTKRAEVRQTCDKRDHAKIEPLVTRIDTDTDKRQSHNDPNRSAYFSDLIDIHR
jgi:hypothetical protein